MRFLFTKLLLAATVACGAAQTSFAQHYDVLTTSQGGKLITGGYDDSNNTAIAPLRVFEGEVVPDTAGDPYLSESPGEPGFRAMDQGFLNNPASMTPDNVYTALTPNTNLLFDWMPMTIGADTRNLFFWDGTGSVNFAPVAASYQLSLTKFGGGGYTETINGSDAAIIAGNVIQQSSGTGTVHTHLFTGIGDFNGVDFDAPAQGFYLYSLRMRMDGFADSDPAFFIFGAYDPFDLTGEALDEFEEAHELAAGWVEANLVPEPSTAIMAAMALAGLIGFRRRKRAC